MASGERKPPRKDEPVPIYFVSVQRVAAMLDVDEGTVRRWVRSGVLPTPVRLGGLLRWRLSELLAWIEKGQGAPVVAAAIIAAW